MVVSIIQFCLLGHCVSCAYTHTHGFVYGIHVSVLWYHHVCETDYFVLARLVHINRCYNCCLNVGQGSHYQGRVFCTCIAV